MVSWSRFGSCRVPDRSSLRSQGYCADVRPLALLLKSYRADAAIATRMLHSFREYNVDGLHLYAIVPAADSAFFSDFSGADVTLLHEEELSQHLVHEPIAGLRPGYVNQEIIKLAFHELGLAEHYFTVDSEAQFLRPFGWSDFIHPDGNPYSVLVEDRDLAVDPIYSAEYWGSRETHLRRIWEAVDVDDPVIRTCHGHQIMSSKVLRSFVTEFLQPRGWSYADAIGLAPYEYSWYNAWLLRSNAIPVHPRDPLVKVFHTEQEYLRTLAAGISAGDLARGYLAVVVNGSFAREYGHPSFLDSKPTMLAKSLSYAELLAVLKEKVRDTSRRRRRSTHR